MTTPPELGGLEAVKLAARVCQAVQAEITTDILEKKDKSPVTIADFSSQAIIGRELKKLFPDVPLIAEEDAAELRMEANRPFLEQISRHLHAAGVTGTEEEICSWIDHGGATEYSSRFWTLDPIDGTKGFLRSEQYAISLALIENGEITASIVCCPNLESSINGTPGSLFYATKGGGAWEEPLDGSAEKQQVHVSSQTDITQARFCESVESGHSSHSHSSQVAERLGIVAEPVRLDSQAKYAVLARGDAEIYMRLPTRPGYVEKIWDHAGGVLLVQEAGGTVTDISGKPLDFTHGSGLKENRGVIVTQGAFQQPVLEALKAVGVE